MREAVHLLRWHGRARPAYSPQEAHVDNYTNPQSVCAVLSLGNFNGGTLLVAAEEGVAMRACCDAGRVCARGILRREL